MSAVTPRDTHPVTADPRPSPADELLEKVLLHGDLSKLSVQQRLQYYKTVCESVGLNPLTKPFDYVRLQGKLTLYARKDATDQLRKLHSVSVTALDITRTEAGIIAVRVTGQDKGGRTDCELGAVHVGELKGEALANAEMKAVTKAKRRLTLSMCGLGLLDETEVVTIPDAELVDAETFHEEPSDEPPAPNEAPPPPAEVPQPEDPKHQSASPYFRYLAKCQELKAQIGEPTYYAVLERHGLKKSNEVNGADTKQMTKIVSALMEHV